jgi:hypothetical protein
MMDASLLTLSPEHARTGCGSGAAKSKLRRKEVRRGMQGARDRGAATAGLTEGLPRGLVHARLEGCQTGATARPWRARYKTNVNRL